MCLSTTEQSFDVFLQNGLLINHVDFSEDGSNMVQYGEPCGVSPDGTKFLFKKRESIIEDQANDDDKKKIQDMMTVSVLHLSIFGLFHVKDVCIRTEMKKCLRKNSEDPNKLQLSTFKNENEWLLTKDVEEFKRRVHIDVRVNDNMDVCAKIQEKPDLDESDFETVPEEI